MKITWLGQAGLLFETGNTCILIDPYLSDSLAAVNEKKKRRVPVDPRFLQIIPDVIVCTHDHLDHTDPDTLAHYLKREGRITVLAPSSAWRIVRQFGNRHNYVQLNRHCQWTHNGIRFTAVFAAHSDPDAIGVLIEAENRVYYVTGDTLYSSDIFADIPKGVDVVFLPVNGEGYNMNMVDAKRFCEEIGAKIAVPLHCGLVDDLDMNGFAFEPKVVPEIYCSIPLD